MRRLISKSLFLSLLLILPNFVHAQVVGISFTTDPQSIRPNTLSEAITLQTQDGSGAAFKTPETIDLEFLSTSATGEFLGSTGNPATKTMSTNTSNRTFFYRDSVEGTFTLTVNATGRTSGTKWSAAQNIIVSNSISSSTTTNSTSSTTTSNQTSTQSNQTSAHSSSVGITNYVPQNSLKIGAGRDRLVTVGIPAEFKADTNGEDLQFNWSFGDGAQVMGEEVSHSYVYPGKYVVVINAKGLGGEAVSRLTVTAVEPKLEVTEANSQYITLANQSSYETNLYGWQLRTPQGNFDFPRDTILPAGGSVRFPTEITKLAPESINGVLIVIRDSPRSVFVAPSPTPLDTEFKTRLEEIQTQALEIEHELDMLASSQVKEEVEIEVIPQPEVASVVLSGSTTTQAVATSSWWKNLKSFLLMKREN